MKGLYAVAALVAIIALSADDQQLADHSAGQLGDRMKHWLTVAALMQVPPLAPAAQGERKMKSLIAALAIIVTLILPACVHAQDATPSMSLYPAHSWTYNVDFKDPDAYGPWVARNVNEGLWMGGPIVAPLSVYRVDEQSGTARRWFRAGGGVLMNAEGVNPYYALAGGLDVIQWTNQAAIAGVAAKAANYYKPFGLTSITANVNGWLGICPRHDSQIAHGDFGYGFGFQLTGKFGDSAAKIAQDILKAGL